MRWFMNAALTTHLQDRTVRFFRSMSLWIVPLCAVVGAELVGPITDAAQWTITGSTTFSPAEIRDALLGDVPVLALLRPGAERSALLTAIEQRTALGFACTGFADCRVRARVVDDHLLITITEGPRDRCGAIAVHGAKDVPAADLIAALTNGWTDSDGDHVAAAWTTGKPVDHDLLALEALANRAARFYRDRHHPQAAIAAAYEPGTAGLDLRLTVSREGPAVRIGTIALHGCERFSEPSVRALIPLHAGDLLPSNAADQVCAALRVSGRFRTQQVTVEQDADAALAKLTVTIAEGRTTPAPDALLTAEQAAALRAAQWLSEHGSHGPEQLVMTLSSDDSSIECIFAGSSGCSFTGDMVGVDGPAGCTLLVRGAVDQWLATTHAHSRLHLPTLAWTFAMTAAGSQTLEPPAGAPSSDGGKKNSGDESAKERQMTIQLTPSTKLTDSVPLTIQLLIEPFYSLSLTTKPGIRTTIADGILTIQEDGFVFTADAATGRLLRLEETSHSKPQELQKQQPNHQQEPPPSALRVIFRIATEDELGAVAARLAALPVHPVAEHPWSTGLQLVTAEMCAVALKATPTATTERDWIVLCNGLAPWGCAEVFAPLERLIMDLRAASMAAKKRGPRDDFTIPPQLSAGQDMITMILGECCKTIAREIAGTYPADTWPATLPRSMFLLLRNQQGAGIEDLRDLAGADRTGPLGLLGAATMLRFIGHPSATVFADFGLEHLNDAGFARELVLLAPIAAEAARALDALPATDAPWLADLTLNRRLLMSSILTAAHVPGTADVRLHTMANLLWHGWLHDWTRQQLTAIAHPEPP